MREKGYTLGGEQSGHMIFLDHASTGDGLVAALQLVANVLRESRPLSELAREAMQAVPQTLVNARLPQRRPLSEMPETLAEVKRVEGELGADGRVVIRWSGTEPKLRVMVEGEDQQQIEALAGGILDKAKSELS